MKVTESFNDNHLICIKLSKDDLNEILNKNSKYFGGCINVEPPKSEAIQILISVDSK